MNLTWSHSRQIRSAHIIRMSNNAMSVQLSDRCMRSCVQVGQPAEFWEAVDGTQGDVILPDHLAHKDHMHWVKLHDDRMTPTQIACALSHYSLWCHCLTQDEPVLILEHDVIMLKPMHTFEFYNMIQYLGCVEQIKGAPQYKIPPHGSAYDQRLRFIARAHAYAIDPQVAKMMITRFVQNGMSATNTADVFLRSDIFPIVQHGVYAYDLWEDADSTVEELPL